MLASLWQRDALGAQHTEQVARHHLPCFPFYSADLDLVGCLYDFKNIY